MPDNNSFIIAAYVVTWTVLLGYLWRLRRVRNDARRRLENAGRDARGGRS